MWSSSGGYTRCPTGSPCGPAVVVAPGVLRVGPCDPPVLIAPGIRLTLHVPCGPAVEVAPDVL